MSMTVTLVVFVRGGQNVGYLWLVTDIFHEITLFIPVKMHCAVVSCVCVLYNFCCVLSG